jgi:hypothetical protein
MFRSHMLSDVNEKLRFTFLVTYLVTYLVKCSHISSHDHKSEENVSSSFPDVIQFLTLSYIVQATEHDPGNELSYNRNHLHAQITFY